jgi:hypothetical protein
MKPLKAPAGWIIEFEGVYTVCITRDGQQKFVTRKSLEVSTPS